MMQDGQLSIEELIESYKDYMGTQAQEIVVLKTQNKKLQKELDVINQKTTKDK